MNRIFLLEDDESLGRTLSERLAEDGFCVQWTRTCGEFRSLVDRTNCLPDKGDLFILDIGVPDGSGLDLLRDFKEPLKASVIFLSAMNSAENRLEGFELGAVDFIPKPFHLKELLLRVRKAMPEAGQGCAGQQRIDFGTLVLDPAALSVQFSSGETDYLNRREFELLLLLVRNSGRVLSRNEILKRLCPCDCVQSGRTIDNSIVRLRQLLSRSTSVQIRSVRGVGYQLLRFVSKQVTSLTSDPGSR